MCRQPSEHDAMNQGLKHQFTRLRIGTAALCVVLSACGGSGDPEGSGPGSNAPTYAIDSNVYAGPTSLADAGRGTRPLVGLADGQGQVSRFVANEVLVRGSGADLSAFLARHPGQVLTTLTPSSWGSSALHVVRLDPFEGPLQAFGTDAAKAGLTGTFTFSNSQAAQLAALTLSESATGSVRVALNFVSEGHLLTSTTEQADQNGVADAFKWGEYSSSVPESVSHAWQFVQAHGIARRVKVAIIDGGFWLNVNGVPCDIAPDASCGSGQPIVALGSSDLPNQPTQFNVIGNGGPTAGGANPNTCTNGASCPWHGNRTASVALGTANNGIGAAGTGGLVADPILLKTDGSDDSIAAAVIDAVGFGADIINLSLGGACNAFCRMDHSLVVNDIMDQALDAGVLIVASAGNDGVDALDQHIWPCQYSSSAGNGVYCVGALQPQLDGSVIGGYYSFDTGLANPRSNYGLTVNIWAPTNLRAMPDGLTGGKLSIHGGTSASAPFVSGVAAMVKAINPSLQARDIKAILGNAPFNAGTALIDPVLYPDPKVSFVIQAYPAVVAAAGGYDLAPQILITSPASGTTIVVDQNPCLFKAVAVDVQDGAWPPARGYKPSGPTPIRWTSDVDGPLSASADNSASFDCSNAPEGLRHITASVTNSAGKTSSATVAVTTRYPHAAPVPVITWPSNGQTIPPGTYTVTGYARSVDPGALGNLSCNALVWNQTIRAAPLPGSNEQCQAQLTLTEGLREIDLSATGKFGDTGQATLFVNVVTQAQLFVQIVSPSDGSYQVGTNGGGQIALVGNAAPIQANSTASYVWSWYPTASGPLAKRIITVGGPNESWDLSRSGICSPDQASQQDITIEAYVEEATLSPPYNVLSSGTAHVNIHLSCEILR